MRKCICSANSSRLIGVLLVFGLLAACAEIEPLQILEPLPDPPRVVRESDAPPPDAAATVFERQVKLPVLQLSQWQGGTDPRWSKMLLPEGTFDLNVEAIPLSRFVHVALGEVLGLSFDMDPAVAARPDPVTLRISKAISAQRMMGMVEQTLAGYDVGIAWDKGHLRILPASKLISLPPTPVALGRESVTLPQGRVITIIPLSFTRPGEVMSFARYYLKIGAGADIFAMNRLNAVMVIGDSAQIGRFARVVSMIDRPAMKGRHLQLIKTVYWKSSEIKSLLQEALMAQGIPVAATAEQPGVFMSPVQPLNALLVAAPNKDIVDWITVWVDQLDTPEAAGDSMQSFIYQVKNSNAKELGAVIGQVIGQQSSDSDSDSDSAENETENAAAVGQGQAGRPGLRMVVDETRNSLVFIGSAGEYAIAYQLLQELDLPAKQVLIEVTIADISLDKTSQLGVEWQFTDYNSNGEINNVISTLGGLGAGSAGLLFTAFDSRGDVKVRLNALAEDGDARILSNPKLLALDNEEARIQVGQQIAVISSEIADTNSPTPGAGDNVLRTFNYIDTGVILSFTPTVMADGIVRLKVYQEVSSAGPSLDNTPPINKRTIETTLVAHSGQTVMIGGLITHNTTSQENKVPVLGDLPILGGLFKSTQKTDTSSEMIVLITPHVIESAAQAAQLTQAFREQLDW